MLKGLETMPVRVRAQAETAAKIADFLAAKKNTGRVLYCWRDDHPQAELARRQMSGGGQMIAFEVAGGKVRSGRLALTSAGQAAFERAVPLWQKAQKSVHKALGGARTRDLHGLLGELPGEVQA